VNIPVTIYVAVGENMTQPPAWLSSWARRAEQLVTTDPTKRRNLYAKSFRAGIVTLGPNRTSGMPTGRPMYTVVITPLQMAAGGWEAY
jgi:hypothetical protein